jgi:hypothetical protein
MLKWFSPYPIVELKFIYFFMLIFYGLLNEFYIDYIFKGDSSNNAFYYLLYEET